MSSNDNEQHECYITLFNHFMDNEADKGSSLPWWLFKKHISNHRSTNDKTQTLAFNTWKFKDVDYKPATRKVGNERVVKYKDGKTIIMVEQNAKKGLAFADIGYVLVSGETAIADEGNKLLENPDVGRLFLGG
mgnify:CR=1 FL=1